MLPTNPFAAGGRLLLLLLLLLALSRPARATHIVGGEMELQYVSGDAYQLTLNLYFDAINGAPGALDTDLTASIFDKRTNQRMTTLTLPLTSNTFVSYTNPVCAVGQLSTRALVYRALVQLPAATYGGAQGYYVAVERCCRNNGISNIVLPGSAGQAFYLEFPAVVRSGQPFRDSTPRLFPALADYACLGELFTYDFGGQDPDRDSLAYDLVTPLNGSSDPVNSKPPQPAPAPYPPITWLPGQTPPLGPLNQIPGTPPLSINARTGRLTVRPARQGLFVFGVRCSEFRDGVKIGETRRDFQLMVLACPRNAPPRLTAQPGPRGTGVYRPGRDTLRFGPGRPRCETIRFTDPDPNSRLSLRVLPVGGYAGPLPTFTTAPTGTVHAPGQPDTLSATLCFPDCMDTQGRVARIDVIVADNGCPLPQQDTVRIAFIAVPPPNAPPTLTASVSPGTLLRVSPGQTMSFDLTATDPDGDPLLLVLSGEPAGFSPAALGAVLTPQAQQGRTRQARFTWPVDCRAIAPAGTVRQLVFQATTTTPCGAAQASPLLRIPFVVDYTNTAPELTTTLPPDPGLGAEPPLVRLPLGQPYQATLSGRDADLNVLTLTAVGRGFDLAAAGMRFSTTPSPAGQAAATFSWLPGCDGGASVRQGVAQDLIVDFTLQEATCQPQPQRRAVRFRVEEPAAPEFRPPNVIVPLSTMAPNRTLTMPTLPPDFCDLRFASIKIFSRWGRQVYESPDRNFSWPGEGSAGLYYYLLTFTTGRTYKGWVEVVM